MNDLCLPRMEGVNERHSSLENRRIRIGRSDVELGLPASKSAPASGAWNELSTPCSMKGHGGETAIGGSNRRRDTSNITTADFGGNGLLVRRGLKNFEPDTQITTQKRACEDRAPQVGNEADRLRAQTQPVTSRRTSVPAAVTHHQHRSAIFARIPTAIHNGVPHRSE